MSKTNRATPENVRRLCGLGIDKYLIWSNEHGQYWRAEERGYTAKIHEAGIYDFKVANKICIDAGILEDNRPAECLVHIGVVNKGVG